MNATVCRKYTKMIVHLVVKNRLTLLKGLLACLFLGKSANYSVKVYISEGEPMARVPEVVRTALSVGTRIVAPMQSSQICRGTRGQVAPKTGTAIWKDTASWSCLQHQVIQFGCIITSSSSLCQSKQEEFDNVLRDVTKIEKLYHASCSQLSTVSNTSWEGSVTV